MCMNCPLVGLLYLSGHNMYIQQRPVPPEYTERMFQDHLRAMLVGFWLWFPLNLKKTSTEENTEAFRHKNTLATDITILTMKLNQHEFEKREY